MAKKAPNVSNIHFYVFNKNDLKTIQDLMLGRNEIFIENCPDISDRCLNLIFNNEKIEIKYFKITAIADKVKQINFIQF